MMMLDCSLRQLGHLHQEERRQGLAVSVADGLDALERGLYESVRKTRKTHRKIRVANRRKCCPGNARFAGALPLEIPWSCLTSVIVHWDEGVPGVGR